MQHYVAHYGVMCLRCCDVWQTSTSIVDMRDPLTFLSFEEWFLRGCKLRPQDWLNRGFEWEPRPRPRINGWRYAEWIKEGFGSKRPLSSMECGQDELSWPNHDLVRINPWISTPLPCLLCGGSIYKHISFEHEDGLIPINQELPEFCQNCAEIGRAHV